MSPAAALAAAAAVADAQPLLRHTAVPQPLLLRFLFLSCYLLLAVRAP